jgi:2-polyprenyl-3-methyl-5-hydroxy-6-metoxy-1,4-benzoquinol methylase
VLEHLADPVGVIGACIDRLEPGGLLYIEVPNVNDALLTLYDVESYHKFHFFRDHLHYFTRSSLERTIRQAGAQAVTISGHNRFGLANHLYWLKSGKPGGHKVWSFLETPSLFREYARALAAVDLSDSLVAQIRAV